MTELLLLQILSFKTCIVDTKLIEQIDLKVLYSITYENRDLVYRCVYMKQCMYRLIN